MHGTRIFPSYSYLFTNIYIKTTPSHNDCLLVHSYLSVRYHDAHIFKQSLFSFHLIPHHLLTGFRCREHPNHRLTYHMLLTLRTSTYNDHDLDGPPVVKVSQSSSLKSPISSIDMFPPFLPKPCPSSCR